MTGVGTNIAANDYNTIQGIISNVLVNLYGQTAQSSQVSTTGVILAQQWQQLLYDITAVNYHQLNVGPLYNSYPLTIPSNGTGVSQAIGVTTYTNAAPAVKVKDADRANYLAVATALANPAPSTVGGVTYPGCYTVSSSSSEQTKIAAGSFLAPSIRIGTSSPWGSTSNGTAQGGTNQLGFITLAVTLTFPTSDAAQYYFNTGGSVVLSGNATAGQTGTVNTKDNSWQVLLSNMGNIIFNYSGVSSSSNNGNGTSYGWASLNANKNISRTIYTIATSSQLYAPNQVTITANLNSSGTVLTFTMRLEDLSTAATKVASGISPSDSLLYSIDTPVTATISGNLTVWYATGNYVSVSNYLPTPVITTPLTA
jgi:hypothetical protein